MRKLLLFGGITLGLLSGMSVNAQTRYLDEVFTDADVVITKNVVYGTNVDIMKNTQILDPVFFQANQAQIVQDMTFLKTSYQTGTPIPQSYYLPASVDTTSVIKVSDLVMDIYEPDAGVDTLANRPVILYVHTGNFLPVGVNQGPAGSKDDSAAVELCKQWAKRGYVAVAANYRHGWNPAATGPTGELVRRATLLNAVYRAIHDMKQVVRTLREDANGANNYGIDGSSIAMYGQGSGGYVALAYNTLDKYAEMALPKFSIPGGPSFIDTLIVGNIPGTDGLINMYFDNGESSDIQACVNAGGALADISWLEGNIEAPMISVHCIRDPFAPFDTGTVIVPTTGENVVDVNGPNMFIPKAVALGLNDSFKDLPLFDPYTNAARSRYGATFNNIPSINVNDPVVVDANAEGLFAVDFDMNNGAPWEWWSLADLQALEAFYASIGITIDAQTIHTNALMTNPNMSKTQALTFIDTIQGYIHPRIMRAMQIGDWEPLSVKEVEVNNTFEVYPNPASQEITVSSKEGLLQFVTIYDAAGKVVYTQTMNLPMTTVNISDLSEGMYVIEVVTDAGQSVEKLIIQ